MWWRRRCARRGSSSRTSARFCRCTATRILGVERSGHSACLRFCRRLLQLATPRGNLPRKTSKRFTLVSLESAAKPRAAERPRKPNSCSFYLEPRCTRSPLAERWRLGAEPLRNSRSGRKAGSSWRRSSFLAQTRGTWRGGSKTGTRTSLRRAVKCWTTPSRT